MHILKFTQDTTPPETIYCYETIGFGDNLSITGSSVNLQETIGFRALIPEGGSEFCYETIGFGDNLLPAISLLLYETIGFNDCADESLVVYCFETIGFSESMLGEQGDFVLRETIGFNEGGYNELYAEHDITFTWRTRTNSYPAYGYGASEYGEVISYGDGDASNLVSFEIQIWKIGGPESNRYLNSSPAGEYDERLLVQSISIVDTDDPDANATYTLTIANNKTLNGGDFLSGMEVEVFTKDSNGVYSFPAVIVANELRVNHEE